MGETPLPVVRRKSSTPIAQASTAHASYEGGAAAAGPLPQRCGDDGAPPPWRGRSSGHLRFNQWRKVGEVILAYLNSS